MSAEVSSPRFTVWAQTGRGDMPTSVYDATMLHVVVDEIRRMSGVGDMTVEDGGVEKARGSWDDMDEVDAYLAALTA